jgi:hypothetical protein
LLARPWKSPPIYTASAIKPAATFRALPPAHDRKMNKTQMCQLIRIQPKPKSLDTSAIFFRISHMINAVNNALNLHQVCLL